DAGTVVWRLDTVRLATRLAKERRVRSLRTLRARLLTATFGRSAPIWSNDPTRVRWDADRQSAVAGALASSSRITERRLAGRGVRAFEHPRRLTTPARAGLLGQLRIANRLARAAEVSRLAVAQRTSRKIGLRAFVRVRAAQVQGWSRIGDAWSTATQHRTLVSQSRLLIKRVPHPKSAAVVEQLVRSLKQPTSVEFGQLPDEPFYPWPRDGAFDTQAVTLAVDKPTEMIFSVYQPDGAVIRTMTQTVDPGSLTFTWDGGMTDGSIVEAGEYRYNLDAVDRLGNKVRVPGLKQFSVVRDTTKPTFKSAQVRHVRSGGTGRIIAGWEVEEIHSPQVRTWLMLRKGSERASIKLHDRVQKATVRRATTLAPGTWNATFVFIDGSGNRTSHNAGQLVVR
ncbi:MAG: hypothetical protein ABI200_04190, partial [Gaiellales bacterium]